MSRRENNESKKFGGLIKKRKVSDKEYKKKYDTLSITMELQRPLDIDEEIKKEKARQEEIKARKVRRITYILVVIALLAYIAHFFMR